MVVELLQEIIEVQDKERSICIMRNANEALKVNKAVEKILAVFEEEQLSEEEMRDALKATEVVLGVKPPMPPHHPPMGPEDRPPHRPPMGPEDMPQRPPHIKNC
jgi:hypothetical protein